MSVIGLGPTSFAKHFCDQNSVLDLKSQAAEWWETLGEAESLAFSEQSRSEVHTAPLRELPGDLWLCRVQIVS